MTMSASLVISKSDCHRSLACALAFVAASFAMHDASLCFAEDVYPNKAVHVTVNFGPGSTADLVARAVCQQFSEHLGKSFVVDYRQGGGGAIGSAFVARSAPDGYSLLLADAALPISPFSNPSVPYDVATDFTPITQIIRTTNVLLVNPSLNTNTFSEFMALARSHPGKLNYGSSGNGSVIHMASELFKTATKLNIVHIPYKASGGEVINALLGDHIQMLLTGIPSALPYVKSGQLRALAVTTDGKRAASMPDVPSLSELGISDMAVYVWFGLAGPAGMPKGIVDKIHAETRRAVGIPSVREQFSKQDAEIVAGTPDEFAKIIKSELQRWSGVVKSAGIKFE
jgi:tripartite-type tricarboxylate transporter receptor subunit TctC